MFRELLTLLSRYYITYIRFPSRLFWDFCFAVVIALLRILTYNQDIGVALAFGYVFTMPFTFLTTVRTMLGEICHEKETGMKEYLKLTGVSSFTYQLYAIIITLVKTAFFVIPILVGIAIGQTMGQSAFQPEITIAQQIYAYILAALGTVSFTLFMSVFFTDAKLAANFGSIAYMSISLVSFIVFASMITEAWYFYVVCLFPQAALVVVMTMGTSQPPPGITPNTMMYGLVFDIFFYLALYLYLDQVLRNENGVRKHPLFFLTFLWRKKRSAIVPIDHYAPLVNRQDISDPEIFDIYDEDLNSAEHCEQFHSNLSLKKVVQVRNLTKMFGNFVAVNNVSFPMYQGQTFCLLGSNGAGKSSTIRMMTGLLSIDAGNILYEGEDLTENKNEIRARLGTCSQHDILFETYTVREHLALIARIRGIPECEVSAQVEKTIQQLGLATERDKYSEQLSGGHKRKLCLAMATVGDTKVVFLDEPTSGMDPQNRRVLWQHIKELKEGGLTILLTTHHLDEAEELSDRISIMSRGRLLALGTSEYLKKNFGSCYHLTLTPSSSLVRNNEFAQMKQDLWRQITNIIPNAVYDEQGASTVLRCSLPFTALSSFPLLFSELEKIPDLKISCEMNNLEDVFVNMILEDERRPENTGATVDFNDDPLIEVTPKYNFFYQLYALLLRRFFILWRSPKILFLMTHPIILIALGIAGGIGTGSPIAQISYLQIISAIAYSLNSSVYCYFSVYEREEKLQYLMKVMGLRIMPYWISNLLFDFFAVTLMNMGIYGLYFWFFAIENSFGQDYYPYLNPTQFLTVTIPHGFAIVTYGYMWSFLFDKALTAVQYLPLGYIALMGVGIYSYGEVRVTSEYLGGVVAGINPTTLYFEIISQETIGLTITQVAYYELGYSLVYFLIALIIDFIRAYFDISLYIFKKKYQVKDPETVEEDIIYELDRMERSPGDPIKVENLVKTYSNGFPAVRNISFGVEEGQIFGLLGPNGAGKSTTFNIMTADLKKTSGSVSFYDKEVKRNHPKLYDNVGICPQFNGLWEDLTVKEHLQFYGTLKGLSRKALNQSINYYLDILSFRKYKNKPAGKLSGGNKRKLSAAIALIGNASLIFMDEPSTGVDPLSRYFLWKLIQKALHTRNASIVLTTHSMHEAESLCHKIGILINGKFACLGQTHSLKEKYSHGYKITVSLNPNSPSPKLRIKEAFPSIVEVHTSSYVTETYHMSAPDMKFSKTFDILETMKKQGVIKDFSIYSTSLEQIFLEFAKAQVNPEEIYASTHKH